MKIPTRIRRKAARFCEDPAAAGGPLFCCGKYGRRESEIRIPGFPNTAIIALRTGV